MANWPTFALLGSCIVFIEWYQVVAGRALRYKGQCNRL